MFWRKAESIGANRTVLSLSLTRSVEDIATSALFVVLPLHVTELHDIDLYLSESILAGLLVAVYGLVITILLPLTGSLSDRAGKRKLFIVVGLLLTSFSTLGYIWAKRFLELITLRALQGLGAAMTISAAMALIAASTMKMTRGGAMGMHSTIRKAGFAAGPLLAGLILASGGFNITYLSIAVIFLVSAIMVQVMVREPTDEIPRSISGHRVIDRELLSARLIWLGVSMLIVASSFSIITALENEINVRLNQNVIAFAIAFSAHTLARIPLEMPLGRLADRFGRKPFVIGGLLFMAPATALLGCVTSTIQLVALRICQGIATAAIFPPAFALAADYSVKGGEGLQTSVLPMGYHLGITLGPMLAGMLATSFFELPFLFGGVISLLGAGVILRFVTETIYH